MEQNIDERTLNDMVDVILVYGIPALPTDNKGKIDAKVESTLREWQKQWPKIHDNHKEAVIEIFNKNNLDAKFNEIIERMPHAIDMAKEYRAKA